MSKTPIVERERERDEEGERKWDKDGENFREEFNGQKDEYRYRKDDKIKMKNKSHQTNTDTFYHTTLIHRH